MVIPVVMYGLLMIGGMGFGVWDTWQSYAGARRNGFNTPYDNLVTIGEGISFGFLTDVLLKFLFVAVSGSFGS